MSRIHAGYGNGGLGTALGGGYGDGISNIISGTGDGRGFGAGDKYIGDGTGDGFTSWGVLFVNTDLEGAVYYALITG